MNVPNPLAESGGCPNPSVITQHKGKGKGQGTCNSSSYMSQTRDQKSAVQSQKWQLTAMS